MSDNFTYIYKILSALEKAMDYEEFDISQIDNISLGISKERWARYMEMLYDSGYIKGIKAYEDITGETKIKNDGIRITLKGLEYLSENGIMQRMYKLAKGIKDIF